MRRRSKTWRGSKKRAASSVRIGRSCNGFRSGASFCGGGHRILLKSKDAAPRKCRVKNSAWPPSGFLLGGAGCFLFHFVELACFHVIDEPADRDAVDVRMVLDAPDLAADVIFQILESVEVDWRDC